MSKWHGLLWCSIRSVYVRSKVVLLLVNWWKWYHNELSLYYNISRMNVRSLYRMIKTTHLFYWCHSCATECSLKWKTKHTNRLERKEKGIPEWRTKQRKQHRNNEIKRRKQASDRCKRNENKKRHNELKSILKRAININ